MQHLRAFDVEDKSDIEHAGHSRIFDIEVK